MLRDGLLRFARNDEQTMGRIIDPALQVFSHGIFGTNPPPRAYLCWPKKFDAGMHR
jgi:hypothetical protein